MVNNYAHLLAAPVTAIFNSSLREGNLPDLWKTATVVPMPKKHPPGSLQSDIRPTSLTPILAKVFETIVLNWADDVITPQIDERQFGGIIRHRYDGCLGGDGQHVVRGYRQVRYLMFVGPNNTSVHMLQESADIIADWSRHNDMRINATKTKEIIVSVVTIIMLHLYRVLL